MTAWNWPYYALLVLVAAAWIPPPGWLPLVCALCLARPTPRAWCFLLVLLLSTWLRVHRMPLKDPLQGAEGMPADVVGVVVEPPLARAEGCRLVLQVHHWVQRLDVQPCRWVVEWRGGRADEVQLGDWWRFEGKLAGWAAPDYPGAWDARSYWSRRGVSQCLRAWRGTFLQPAPTDSFWSLLWNWRGRLTQRLMDRSPRAALLCAVVYGDGSRLPPPLAEQFRRAGVSHLLVASGANVAILVGWLFLLGGWLGYAPHRCAGAALLLVPPYVLLAGGSPAMLRAGAMAGFALLARWTGHSTELGRTLVLASLAVLLWDPNTLFDLGFQLSFAAVASLAWLQGPLLAFLTWLRPAWLRSATAAGLACSLGLAPVCWCSFHALQPTALFANLWMGPLLEGLLPVGLICSWLDLLEPRLGWCFTRLLDPWLWFIERSVEFWSDVSLQLLVPEPDWRVWGLWFLALAMVWWGPRLALLGLAAAASWLCLLPQRPGLETEVRWLWLGPAPCVWVRHSGQRHIVLLALEAQRPRAEQMRLQAGWGPYQKVLVLQQPGWGSLTWDGAWLEYGPGWIRYREQQLTLGFAENEIDLQGLSWGLDSQGRWCWAGGRRYRLEKGKPWRLWRQRRQIWMAPWR